MLCENFISGTDDKKFLDNCSGVNADNAFKISEKIKWIGALKDYKPLLVEVELTLDSRALLLSYGRILKKRPLRRWEK